MENNVSEYNNEYVSEYSSKHVSEYHQSRVGGPPRTDLGKTELEVRPSWRSAHEGFQKPKKSQQKPAKAHTNIAADAKNRRKAR